MEIKFSSSVLSEKIVQYRQYFDLVSCGMIVGGIKVRVPCIDCYGSTFAVEVTINWGITVKDLHIGKRAVYLVIWEQLCEIC